MGSWANRCHENMVTVGHLKGQGGSVNGSVVPGGGFVGRSLGPSASLRATWFGVGARVGMVEGQAAGLPACTLSMN